MKLSFVIGSVLFLGAFCLSVSVQALTVAANATLQRGTQLTERDLIIKETGKAPSSDVLAEYVGMELARTIYQGTPIRLNDVKPPVLVRRNSRVSMIYRIGRLEIKAVGRAIQEGGLGDRVTIINLDSRKKVDGVVTGRGTVEMNP